MNTHCANLLLTESRDEDKYRDLLKTIIHKFIIVTKAWNDIHPLTSIINKYT